jgi:hypothetical protein
MDFFILLIYENGFIYFIEFRILHEILTMYLKNQKYFLCIIRKKINIIRVQYHYSKIVY